MAESEALMTPKLLDALYTEAMVLADEARSYFESGRFHDECDADACSLGFVFLRVTQSHNPPDALHCMAVLNQKALYSGELTEGEAWNHDQVL